MLKKGFIENTNGAHQESTKICCQKFEY